jgi:hypothetical protein
MAAFVKAVARQSISQNESDDMETKATRVRIFIKPKPPVTDKASYRIHVSMTPEQKAKLALLAREQGKSLNGYIVSTLAIILDQHTRPV